MRTPLPRRLGRAALLPVAGLLLLGLAGCSSETATPPGPTGSVATGPATTGPGLPTSTVGPDGSTTTASTAPATPSTPAPTTTEPRIPRLPLAVPRSVDGISPDGSGCTPPPGDALPDGIWFGVVRQTFPDEGSVAFDLACFYTGEAANVTAASRGEESPVPNGYLVVNDNPQTYLLGAGADLPVLVLADNGGSSDWLDPQTGVIALGSAEAATDADFVVWLAIVDGRLVGVQQLYLP